MTIQLCTCGQPSIYFNFLHLINRWCCIMKIYLEKLTPLNNIFTFLLYPPGITITLNLQNAWFPAPSVKVYTTWVVPTLKNVPGGLLMDGVPTPDASVAVGGVQVTTIPLAPGSVVRVMSPGQLLTTGGVTSAPWKGKNFRWTICKSSIKKTTTNFYLECY